jgi:hypothetical protein
MSVRTAGPVTEGRLIPLRTIGIAASALGAALSICGMAIPASAAVTPAITLGACTHATWVHVDSKAGLQCFAHPGTEDFSNDPLYTFCAGNNNGYFIYYNVGADKDVKVNYSAGTRKSYPAGDDLEILHIASGGGSDSC